jgi:hypothetical protein
LRLRLAIRFWTFEGNSLRTRNPNQRIYYDSCSRFRHPNHS